MRMLFRKYYHLSATDQWLFWQIVILLPLTEISVRILGFKKTVSLLQRFNNRQETSSEKKSSSIKTTSSTDIMNQITRHRQMLRRVRRYMPYTGRCLSQSLVLWSLLARLGIETMLHFGQNKQQDFKAHAWLEYDGLPINANKHIHQHYKVFKQSMIVTALKKS